MARNKGAVGFEIGTSKLGAYSMEDTLEIFEKEGYVKYKDLDQYFKDCYFDFENKLSEKEFVEKSKKNILKSSKYKQFMNNEVKMCNKCKNVKPLKSFQSDDRYLFGVIDTCKVCKKKYIKEYRKTESGKKSFQKTKKKVVEKYKKENAEYARKYREKNRNITTRTVTRCRLRKFLKEKGYKEDTLTRQKIDILLNLKTENNIFKYSELIEKFGSVLNG